VEPGLTHKATDSGSGFFFACYEKIILPLKQCRGGGLIPRRSCFFTVGEKPNDIYAYGGFAWLVYVLVCFFSIARIVHKYTYASYIQQIKSSFTMIIKYEWVLSGIFTLNFFLGVDLWKVFIKIKLN
jgi:hypothetical protein